MTVNRSELTKSHQNSIVVFEDVDKSYDAHSKVVDRLNLSIGAGEFLSLLGPSGSGKTTTLIMLAGFEDPSAGQILLNGQPLSRVPPYRRNIGMVFQSYALFPHMTVEGNIAYPLKLRRIPREDIGKRVAEALQLVGLKGMGRRRPGQLSGGQQQRVALARALVFEPAIVLMDEPLGALDKQLREQMQFEIKRLHDQLGLTVVYVTHDQSEALTMSDRIAVFSGGKIRQIGSAVEVYENPTDLFVAGFIGENNRLTATIDRVEGRECVVRLPDGSAMMATATSPMHLGEKVCLSIRPERLILDAPSERQFSLTGRIEDRIYFGDQIRLVLRLGCSQHLIAKVPIAAVSQHSHLTTELAISWAPEVCRAFPYE